LIMPTPVFKTITATHPWQNLNTPQTLWAGFFVICALDILLLIAAIVGVRVHRDAMQTVGNDTVPSIIHAQHIKSALADMDADAANELLTQSAVEAYEKRRIEAAKALIGAARNITFDKKEQEPIEAIQVGMGTYERKVQAARDLRATGDASYVNAYQEAARVMDNELLPNADQLDKVNHDVLEDTYRAQSSKSMTTVFFIVVTGVALVAALIAIQKFLNQRTNRILNPMLILATLLTLGFVIYTFDVLGEERRELKVAKEDAYDSIHALWQSRAVAYTANADESRYLLDPAHADLHEQNFKQKADALASLESGTTFEQILESARDARNIDGLHGYLAKELNNITFPGEREAAVETLNLFIEYLRIDGRIRVLQRSGKHADAIRLCIGTNEGESNWAFDRFDQKLGETLKINDDAFHAAVDRGFDALKYFEIKAGTVAFMVAVLAFLGLIKRIQEYR
jgi:hypothetical protein